MRVAKVVTAITEEDGEEDDQPEKVEQGNLNFS